MLVLIALLLIQAQPCLSGTLRLGCIFSGSGQWESLGREGLRGASLAVDMVNSKGGINGAPVELVSKTAGGDPLAWPKLVDELKKEKVFAVTGMNSGSLAQSVLPEAKINSLPLVLAGVSYDICLDAKACFQTSYTNQAQARAMAKLAKDNQADGMILMALTDSDSNADLAAKLDKTCQASGGVIIDRVELTDSESEVDEMLARLKDQAVTPGGFFVVADAGKTLAAVEKIRKAGYAQIIICRDTLNIPGARKQLASDPALSLAVQCAYQAPDQAVGDFVRLYQAKYGQAPSSGFAAIGFDAAAVALEAARIAGGTEPEDITNALNSMTYTGPSGQISFTASSHRPVNKTVPCASLSGGGQYIGNF